MAQDGLGCPTPFVHDLIWLTVFVRDVSARLGNCDGVNVRTGSICGHSFPMPCATTSCAFVWVRRCRPTVTMIMITIGGTAYAMTMFRKFIDSEGGKMKVFQILNEQVTIIQGSKVYIDSLDNFKNDSGVDDLPGMVVYDESQKCCVVDSLFYNYPNDTYEGYLSKLQDYLDAKAKREYVPPAEPTAEEKKTALTADYNSGVEELTKSYNIAVLRGDTETQASIKQDFSDLQEAYKAEMEALK